MHLSVTVTLSTIPSDTQLPTSKHDVAAHDWAADYVAHDTANDISSAANDAAADDAAAARASVLWWYGV